MKIRTISACFKWAQPFCSRNPTLYLTASLRCHRLFDVNIDQCGNGKGRKMALKSLNFYTHTCYVKCHFTFQAMCYRSQFWKQRFHWLRPTKGCCQIQTVQCNIFMSPPFRVGRHGILFLPWLSVHPFVTKLCLLCNLKTVQDIFMKFHININQIWTMCRAQEP